ncbi:MAG: helix-turn-helix transcriptional regulator [Oscillospiraceae bacterium]|nr:helix-turn-helix transcriptional regulator [Oscillospiraceae bacterium]
MYFSTIDIIATGNRIKELRLKNNLSVAEVALELGLSAPQTVYKWERGVSLPSIDNIFLLAELFGVTVNELVQLR